MAYLDFRMHETPGHISPPSPRIHSGDGLKALERTAVMLARIDPVSSLEHAGFRYRVADALLGPNKINRLSDPHLEALRSFGVAVAHNRDDLALREQQRLSAFGFSPLQIDEARDLASHYRRTRH